MNSFSKSTSALSAFLLANDFPEWCVLSQVLNQIVHVVQIPSKQLLLLLRGLCSFVIRSTASITTHVCIPPFKRCHQLARTPLQRAHCRVRCADRSDRRRLRHEVEVEELDDLEFDVLCRATRLEERGYCEEAVEVLEGAGVLRGTEEGGDEDEKGAALDSRAVVGIKKVQK